jgi:hypothetical protein
MLTRPAEQIDNDTPPRDFWLSCGHHLLDRSEGGGLVVTDSFLKAYLARPELLPTDQSCPVERTLHAALLADPRQGVAPAIMEAIADTDARENWRMLLAFRDRLLTHETLESAYLNLVRRGAGETPPLFLNQLVHAILRNILDGSTDSFQLRAGEIFFRPQKLTVHENALLAADEELIAGTVAQPVSPLVAMLGQPAKDIDVLVDANADSYWARSDMFDMALDLTAGRRGQAALADVIGRWIAHLLGIAVDVVPIAELKDARLTWYVGLDAQGTAIGDALWRGELLDDPSQARIAALFRLTFRDQALVLEAARGEPVYLIMAMAPDMTLRMKPQNLVVGLPIEERGPAS